MALGTEGVRTFQLAGVDFRRRGNVFELGIGLRPDGPSLREVKAIPLEVCKCTEAPC
jgi:hypothetical protein